MRRTLLILGLGLLLALRALPALRSLSTAFRMPSQSKPPCSANRASSAAIIARLSSREIRA